MSKNNKPHFVKPSLSVEPATNRNSTHLFSSPQFQQLLFPLFLFCFSIAINLIILSQYLNSPFAQVPKWDAENYWKLAQQISSGNLLGNAIFHQSPLYPYFLAILISLFGQHLLPVYIIQSFLSAGSTVFIYFITKKITGQRATGFCAGLMFALFGMQVFYSLKVLSECLSIFLMLCAAFLLLSNKGWKIFVLAGISFGLAVIAKPNLLLAVPLILAYLFWILRSNWREFFSKTIALLIPILLLIAVVAVRNYSVGKDFVLISSNGGENFFIGNHKGADGTYSVIPGMTRDIEHQDEDVIALAQTQTGTKMKRSEVSRYLQRQGLQFIIHNPREYLKIQLAKIRFLFSGAERTTMYYLGFEAEKLTPVLRIAFVNFYLILPLFIIGLIGSFRNWKRYVLIYSLLVVNMANVIIFFYDTRFMLLAMPFWIIFAAMGGMHLWNMIKLEKSLKIVKRPIVIMFLVTIYGSILIYSQDRKAATHDWHMYLTIGNILFEQGKLDAALDAYTQSNTLNKSDWLPVFGASKVYFRKGYKDIAVQVYDEAFPKLSADFKMYVLRDKDLDPVREYSESLKGPSQKGQP